MANGRMREVVWHFCENCHARISPYTKFDAETEAPELGRSGASILLRSFNNANPEDKLAYCLSCKTFVRCERMTETEIWTMYLNRRGVVVRFKRLRELEMLPRKVVSINRRRFTA